MIKYSIPKNWILYDIANTAGALAEAKAAILSLRAIPYQREWVDALQKMELKREIAGTSRIEGADFTEKELEQAISETPEQLATRSQRQAHAAMKAYKWIAKIPNDKPITKELICEIHNYIVTGADDDHCPPGKLRGHGQNVNFGQPRHRGAEGGDECENVFVLLVRAVQAEYKGHDPLIQALAAHYHLAAMHPFHDGNGRTARALEALFLQRAGLRDTCFISMSNYYHDEKQGYLQVLSETRAAEHDLTGFIKFGLKGLAQQSNRLLGEIKTQVAKALCVNLMYDLFNRLKNKRTRVLGYRQVKLLKILLDLDSIEYKELLKTTAHIYQKLTNPEKALVRDLVGLRQLQSIAIEKLPGDLYRVKARLEWPTEVTETEFFARLKKLPKGKTHSFLE